MTHLFMFELGPYDILIRIRELFGVEHNEFGDSHKHYWTSCFLCASFWIGLVTLALPRIVNLPFAISAIAILIDRYYVGDSKS